jgi:predicted secreted Zn-dependent protease
VRRVAAVLLIAVAAVGPGRASPLHRLEIVEHEASYDIHGSDLGQLRQQLEQRRPDNGHWHGLTQGRLEVRTEFEPAVHGCDVRRLEVLLEITVWLPRWVSPSGVAPLLQQRWEASLAGLRRHEDGHRAHLRDAAAALYERLLTYDAADRDCAGAEQFVQRALTRSRVRLRVKSDGYDALTGYGAHQGATL